MMERLKRPSPWHGYALRVIFLAALALLLLRTVDWAEAWALLSGVRPGPLAGAAALLTVQTLLSALRWRLTAAQLGIVMETRKAIREYYLSQVVNQSLPGGVLGDAGRAFRARQQAGFIASGQAVVFERLAGQIALLAILILALVVHSLGATHLELPFGLRLTLWVGLGLLLALGAIAWGMARRYGVVGRSVAAFHRAICAPSVLGSQLALSFGTALCNIAAFALCATAIGAPLSPLEAAILVPMILFAMVLPLSISGWGLREGAAAVLFPLAGLSASAGLASSVAFGLVFLSVTLPGIVMIKNAPEVAKDSATATRP